MGYSTTQTIEHKRWIGGRRRRGILYVLLTSFLVWAAMSFFGQMDHLMQQRLQLAQLESDLAVLQKQHEQQKLEIERLNDLEYIEQIARKQYFLAKPGEILFITPAHDENNP